MSRAILDFGGSGSSPCGKALKPKREHATHNGQTYFVTSETWQRRPLFRADPWIRLFCKTLLAYRSEAYLLHAFVLMPEHFHLLITPLTSLERAVQFVKGGFSHRAKMEFGAKVVIWQREFSDHRILNMEDYTNHVRYIFENPVRRHLCLSAEQYPCSSAYPGWRLDPLPQGLKPGLGGDYGTAEAVPLQNGAIDRTAQKGNATPQEAIPGLSDVAPVKVQHPDRDIRSEAGSGAQRERK